MQILIFASRLMKAREVHAACVAFREKDVELKRQPFMVLITQEASESAGEQVGCL